MEDITFEIIKKRINNKYYDNKLEYPKEKLLKEGHVFDENLSVKRNIEMVREHNNEIILSRKKYDSITNELYSKLELDTIEAIMNESDLNLKQAKEVYSYAYRQYHSGGRYEVINSLPEIIEFANNIILGGIE